MTLDEFKQLKNQFEADGRHATGVYLTSEQAKALRQELHQYYGSDPGEYLTTLYGLEILGIDAEELLFERL